MIFFNDIINAKGTPSIQEDILANRPTASQAGRLFIQTDNPYNIFRDTGTAWQQISGSGGSGVSQIIAGSNVTISPAGGTGAVTINSTGGGGGSQNLDNVLSLGGVFTANRTTNLNSYRWQLTNIDQLKLSNTNSEYWNFTDTYLKFINSSGDNNLFSVDYTTFTIMLGDFNVFANGSKILLDDSNNLIVATIGTYTFGSYSTNNYGLVMSGYNISLGAYNSGNYNSIKIDDLNSQIKIFTGIADSNSEFFLINTTELSIGDIGFNYNNFYMLLSREISVFKFYYQEAEIGFSLDCDNGTQYMGDISGYYSHTRIEWDLVDSEIYFRDTSLFEITNSYRTTINATSQIQLISDNEIDITTQTLNLTYLGGNLSLVGTGITQNTSGSTSTVHLKVNINGTAYVIQLRNP